MVQDEDPVDDEVTACGNITTIDDAGDVIIPDSQDEEDHTVDSDRLITMSDEDFDKPVNETAIAEFWQILAGDNTALHTDLGLCFRQFKTFINRGKFQQAANLLTKNGT